MVTSLRFWLIAAFSAILLIFLAATYLFINSINQSKKIEEYHSNLKTTRILLLETNKLKEDILIGDFNKNGFYASGTSTLELEFTQLKEKVGSYIRYLENSKITEMYKLSWKVKQLKVQFTNYTKNYNELIFLYKLKGFKDYGLEGKMREFAHNIYDFNNKDVRYYCLILRKHEKDFLLRKDFSYVNQFHAASREFIVFINNSETLKKSEKDYLFSNLYFYEKNFNQLSRIESRIGVQGQNGYLGKSKRMFDDIADKIEDMDNELKLIDVEIKENLEKDTLTILIILVIFLLTTIIVLTQLITKSVKTISTSFSKYVNSGFNIDSVYYKKSNIKEFNTINISFLKMAKEIHIFTNFFREKVHERTMAIQQQKEEILAQQIQIGNQYNDLLATNSELEQQKQLLAIKDHDIQDSLRYAKRIQTALQPSKSKLTECFPDFFTFSKAKEVVSGDFHLVYRTTESEGFDNDRVVFLAADCTGHGVPGAIMSVLGINTLFKNIKELKHTDPGKILNLLNQDLNQVLAHDKVESDIVADGMDIAIFSFDKKLYKLDYSIAKFPHFFVRDSQILRLEAQKSSIGYSYFEPDGKNFRTSTLQLQPGDCLYLFSDGLQDQFGGPLNKKFKRNNIRELILSMETIPMSEQKEILKKTFTRWKKKLPQTDDVMVMGIRF